MVTAQRPNTATAARSDLVEATKRERSKPRARLEPRTTWTPTASATRANAKIEIALVDPNNTSTVTPQRGASGGGVGWRMIDQS